MKNKCAESKIFSLWWLLAVFAAIGVVILAVNLFYSAEYDVRLNEAAILNNHLADCLIEQGNLRGNFSTEEFSEQIFSLCNLEEKFFSEEGLYFFRLNISKEDSLVFYGGQKKDEENCNIYLNGIKGNSLPRCILNKEPVIYEGKNYVLEILTGSNNFGKKGGISYEN